MRGPQVDDRQDGGAVRGAALLLGLLLAAACTNPVDRSPNPLPGDDVAATDAGDAVAAPEDATTTTPCDCLQPGQWFRFDKLKVESLDERDHPVMMTLNSLWKKDIEQFELNFYFEVTEVAPQEVKFRVINGARVGTDGICLLPHTQADLRLPREGCKLLASDPSAMNVYAGTPAHPKNCSPDLPVQHAIPVRNAVLTLQVDPSCQALDQGHVTGNFSQVALTKTCTCVNPGQLAEKCLPLEPGFVGNNCDGCNDKYQNLEELLQAFSGDEPLTYSCQSDDGKAVCLEASFAATRIETPPGLCP